MFLMKDQYLHYFAKTIYPAKSVSSENWAKMSNGPEIHIIGHMSSLFDRIVLKFGSCFC